MVRFTVSGLAWARAVVAGEGAGSRHQPLQEPAALRHLDLVAVPGGKVLEAPSCASRIERSARLVEGHVNGPAATSWIVAVAVSSLLTAHRSRSGSETDIAGWSDPSSVETGSRSCA
jgi:hypothetical protein